MTTQSNNQSQPLSDNFRVVNPNTNEHLNLTPFYQFLERLGGTTFDAWDVLDSVLKGYVQNDNEFNETNLLEVMIDLSNTLKLMGIDNVSRKDWIKENFPVKEQSRKLTGH